MDEQTREISDYLVALKKRKRGIIGIATVVMLIGIILAYLLPSVYRSSSTILIEQQEIPAELVMSTVTGFASERIQIIKARVMTRTNLLKIVDEFDLYSEDRTYETKTETIQRAAENISIDMISAEVVDPRTGRPSTATIAFSLSFTDESPNKAQRVVNKLTSLFLEENLKSRTQKAEDTSVFLEQETDRLGREIAELENKLAEFKMLHKDELPEVQTMNMQMLQRKELEMANIETKLLVLEDKKFYLAGQLAQIEPDNPALMGASTRLKLAETEYLSLKARYSSEHPDVKRMERQIEALRAEASPHESGKSIARDLTELRAELASAQDKYTDDHPDVVRLQNEIELLNTQLDKITDRAEDDYYKEQPDNPAYITLSAQLASIDSEIKAIKEQRVNTIAEVAELEKTLVLGPEVEREYRALMRDYQNSVRQYQESKAKQSMADVAKQLETEKKGERFSLIDPAQLPEQPISPNRPAILLLALVLAIGGGISYAFVADAISGSVRGARNIQYLLQAAPLAVVPFQPNFSEVQQRKTVQKRTILLAIVILIAAVLIIHFLVNPLDVLWFRYMRRFDSMVS